MSATATVPRSATFVPDLTVPAAAADGGTLTAPTSRGVYRRRRVVAVAMLVVVVSLLAVAVGRVGAQAGLADPVAGHVVVEPGETLWDVAVATAPSGVDPREQLTDLRELNGIGGSHLDAWAVVLVPAR